MKMASIERRLHDKIRGGEPDEGGVYAEEGEVGLLLPKERDDALVAYPRRYEVDDDREQRQQDHVGEHKASPADRVGRDEGRREEDGAQELEYDNPCEQHVDCEEDPLRVLIGRYLLPVDVVRGEPGDL
jgi:hypothetical protein